jgi:hypothetical protein
VLRSVALTVSEAVFDKKEGVTVTKRPPAEIAKAIKVCLQRL